MTPISPMLRAPRAETGVTRVWRLVSSFFAIAARSLAAAGA